MEPPVASVASAATESPETILLQPHTDAPENPHHKMKIAGEYAVVEPQNSADSTPPAAMAAEFRTTLRSITSAAKNGLLTDHSSTYTDSEYSSFLTEGINAKSEIKFVAGEAIHDLRRIAGRMIESGRSKECIHVYVTVRKSGMDESFKKLGIENLSSKIIQRMEWNIQQKEIGRWIRNAEICIRVLFANERRLTEQIFKGLGTENIDEVCFMETVKDYATLLFSFAEAISSSRKSPEKLFRILDLYKVLSDLLVDIKAIFLLKSGEFVRKKVVEVLFSLSDAAREILAEFEKAVFGEPTKVLMSEGSIHPLTKIVMNYVDSMANYKQILIELIVFEPSSTHSSKSELNFDEISEFQGEFSPLVLHLIWIIKILRFNLKAKSKHYKDAALAHFFMMNNVHYIVEKIKGSSELREMIGDDYLNKLRVEYNSAASNYLKTSWKRIFDCLKLDEGLQKMGGFLYAFVLRQRFKAFNSKFKDVLANQATWFVADDQLREELRFSILQMLIPVYTSFLDRYRRYVESEKQHREKYIKYYSPEDVEKAVMNLFEVTS